MHICLNIILLLFVSSLFFKDTTGSLKKLLRFRYQKKQNKWPIELWTLKQEMETDEDHATMRESFSLVQNIIFIDYTDILSIR